MKQQQKSDILEFIKKILTLIEENRIVMLIIDGLGISELKLSGFKKKVYQTVFPSSTPTFFYSLHSLVYPKDHGFLDWYMMFKDEIITIPPWRTIDGKELELNKDVRKKDVFPFKPLSKILWKKGFSSVYYTPFADSLFTMLTSEKAEIRKINFLSDVFPLKDANFSFIYWPSIDTILHERYKDEGFEVEIKTIEYFIEILKRKIPKNSLFFVLSDHGLTYCKKRYLLPTIDSIFPVGGGRVAFYKDLDKEIAEKIIKEKRIPAKVFELNELESFKGRISKRCYKNFGNIVVVAEPNVGFKYPFEVERGKKKWDIASHGGTSKEEMFVNIWEYKK